MHTQYYLARYRKSILRQVANHKWATISLIAHLINRLLPILTYHGYLLLF